MSQSSNPLMRLYDRVVLSRPGWVLAVLLLVGAGLATRIKDFRLDASADSLILEHDDDLRYFRKITERYHAPEFLFVTYTPPGDLLGDASLAGIRRLRDRLRELPRVQSVVTILDVPLLRNPPVPLKELKGNIKTLESTDVDRELARTEFAESPIYRELIVSPDMASTAIQVNLRADEVVQNLLARRTELRDKERDGTLTPDEAVELGRVAEEYVSERHRLNGERHRDIAIIRDIMAECRGDAKAFLGGVAMVSDDMISFIKSDLKVFGCGMALFLILMLSIIFGRKRWILLPMLCCAYSAIVMMGALGVSGWEVTVISSNFISLQLIMTMAIAIHLVVRYNELLSQRADADAKTLMHETVQTIFKPCLFTTTTTIAGFSSLVFCDILPVINFGWMMSVGLTISLTVCFLLFPACLLLMRRAKPRRQGEFGAPMTAFFARVTETRGRLIFAVAATVIALTAIGISRLEVENSFIDYFRKSTEIYQGMAFIDQQLGGTTPLDITIEFPQEEAAPAAPTAAAAEDDDFGDFGEFEEPEEDDGKYWYTPQKLATVRKVHEYLESQPAVGKVQSLHTLVKVAEQLTGETDLDGFTLALLFNGLPEDFKEIVLYPYVSLEHSQARVSVRIRDSLPALRRDALLKQIRRDLGNDQELPPEQFRLTSMMVLYNNMLQSLFSSQVTTIGVTVLMLLGMFLVLFRSVKLSLIAILPNLCASLVVPGVMGLAGIPLDMMTITIVAISVGIAVDNTIHYIHRFRHEFPNDHNYVRTMHRCHGSIGNAMYYTSITIIIGFSILAFSNFIPSVLFGLLTGLAMAMALLAALLLLPRLILFLRPFGPEDA